MTLHRAVEMNMYGLSYTLFFYVDDENKYLGLTLKNN